MIDLYELNQKIWAAQSKGEEYQMTQEEFEFVAVNIDFTREERNEIYTLNNRRRNFGEKLDKIGTGMMNASVGIMALTAFATGLAIALSSSNDKEYDTFDKSMAVLASNTKDTKLLNDIEQMRSEKQMKAKAEHDRTRNTLLNICIFAGVIGGIGATAMWTGATIKERDISSEKKRANEFLVYNRRFKQKQ